MTIFGKLGPGGFVITREIPQSAMMKCPHCIMVPEHYRTDNTCKCDDPNETVMAEWGYVWKDGQWRSSTEE